MDYSGILMIVVMLAIFYFMLIRPENKRKRAAEEMRSSVKKGERITTIGGLVGRVVQVNDSTVVFETSEDRVRVEVAKWGIQSTETVEKAAAENQKKGFFGKKSADETSSAALEGTEQAKKDGDSNFDPEIK